MKLLFVIICLASIQLEFVESKSIRNVEEPRIFFRQILDATGFFPIEINVPDTVSSMMSGLSSMYDTVSGYFGSGDSEGQSQPEEQTQQQIIHDENSVNSKMTQRKKKVKKFKKKRKAVKSNNDYDYFLSYFLL